MAPWLATLRPVLALIGSMSSIQVGASIAKSLFTELSPAGTVALRLLFAAIILVVVFRPWRGPITSRAWQTVAIYGLSLGCMNLPFYLALERIPLGVAVALEFLGPLSVSLCLSRRATDFLWAGLAALGVVLMAPAPGGHTSLDAMGVLYVLGAAAGWALYILFGQRAGQSMGSGQATALGMVVAACAVLPVGASMAAPQLTHTHLWPLALLVALFSSALPYCVEMMALKQMPARTFGVLMSMEPAVACVVGLVLLDEHLSMRQWLAIACIIVASLGTCVFGPKRAAVLVDASV